uniref:TFIIB domain-containing protein n=1 Tax=Panagrellus redivivus TaxID=6233 RepID=A0A7E4ZTL8_PANRE
MEVAHSSRQSMLQLFNDPEPIRDRASNIFDLVLESKTLRHENYDLLAATCVQLARRESRILLMPQQINVATGISIKRLRKCESVVQRTLHPSFGKMVQPESMKNFCKFLHLPQPVQAAAIQIIKNVVNVKLHHNFNYTSLAIAAAAVFRAFGLIL